MQFFMRKEGADSTPVWFSIAESASKSEDASMQNYDIQKVTDVGDLETLNENQDNAPQANTLYKVEQIKPKRAALCCPPTISVREEGDGVDCWAAVQDMSIEDLQRNTTHLLKVTQKTKVEP